jgi:hypothetical protein|mmetsp:Transcript_99896/g.158074  ORF Transcript_99896/g.158074 Transcript_99896/m.158074 type:complete len:429 (+) Transcript_99896:64-1350(+)
MPTCIEEGALGCGACLAGFASLYYKFRPPPINKSALKLVTDEMREGYGLKLPWFLPFLMRMKPDIVSTPPPEPGTLPDKRTVDGTSPYTFVEVVLGQIWLVEYVYQPEAMMTDMMMKAFKSNQFCKTIVSRADDEEAKQLAEADIKRCLACCAVPKPEIEKGGLLKKGIKSTGNMVVVKMASGKLLLYSPVHVDTIELLPWLKERGGVGVAVAPAAAHTLHMKSVHLAFPEAQIVAGTTAAVKLRKAGVRIDAVYTTPQGRIVAEKCLGNEFSLHVLDGDPIQEMSLFHKASQSLLVCDLLYGGSRESPQKAEWWKDPEQFMKRNFFRQYFHPDFANGSLPVYRWQAFHDPSFPVHPPPAHDSMERFGDAISELLNLKFSRILSPHIPPSSIVDGELGHELLTRSWSWTMGRKRTGEHMQENSVFISA